MNPTRLYLVACLGLLFAGAALAVTGVEPDDEPPRPYDAEPGDLPVPPDSGRWERMRESYMRRLLEMRRMETDDDDWDATVPVATGARFAAPDVIIERTDPAYPLLSFQFGTIRTGPALQKAMAVLQKKSGRAASAEVAAILRDAVGQMQRAEFDPQLIRRFNTEAGGSFTPKAPNASSPRTLAALSSQRPGAPVPILNSPPGTVKTTTDLGLRRGADDEGTGLPPRDQPLGALQQPPVQQPPPDIKPPEAAVAAGTATAVTPGVQAGATKEALKLAESRPEDTGKLREAVAGAEKQASPLLLDLDGNGIADTTTAERGSPDHGAFRAAGSVYFDVTGRGLPRRTEWIKPGQDGLLVLDANGNGVADSASELFGDTDGFADGFAKLALLDADRDGGIAGPELVNLHAWIDDGDGHCEAHEMKRVTALGITRIWLHHEQYVGSFVRDGRTCRMWDWFPHWQ